MKNALVLFSCLPCIPFILLALSVAANAAAHRANMWEAFCLATFFGVFGITGLILAGIKRSYVNCTRRLVVAALIIFGYVGFTLGLCLLLFQDSGSVPMMLDRPPAFAMGRNAHTFPLLPLTVICIWLAWPLVAGGVALNDLRKANE